MTNKAERSFEVELCSLTGSGESNGPAILTENTTPMFPKTSSVGYSKEYLYHLNYMVYDSLSRFLVLDSKD